MQRKSSNSYFNWKLVQRMLFVYFFVYFSTIQAFGLINIFNMKGQGVPSNAFVDDIPQLNGKFFR